MERDELRKVFFESWRKHRELSPVEPLEAQLIDIILMHPEYHSLLEQPDNLHNDHVNDPNPFLHLSLHLALREQIATNRPADIKLIHQDLCIKLNDIHNAEHQMMESLAEILWQAQRDGQIPDEQVYLEKLKSL